MISFTSYSEQAFSCRMSSSCALGFYLGTGGTQVRWPAVMPFRAISPPARTCLQAYNEAWVYGTYRRAVRP